MILSSFVMQYIRQTILAEGSIFSQQKIPVLLESPHQTTFPALVLCESDLRQDPERFSFMLSSTLYATEDTKNKEAGLLTAFEKLLGAVKPTSLGSHDEIFSLSFLKMDQQKRSGKVYTTNLTHHVFGTRIRGGTHAS